MIKIKFNNSEFKTLSSICIAIGQVLFGAFLAAAVLPPLDASKILVVLLQLGAAIVFWYFSLLFAKRGKL